MAAARVADMTAAMVQRSSPSLCCQVSSRRSVPQLPRNFVLSSRCCRQPWLTVRAASSSSFSEAAEEREEGGERAGRERGGEGERELSGSVSSASEPGWGETAWERAPVSVKLFPWSQFFGRFAERLLQLTWEGSKWVLVPFLFAVTVAELGFAWRDGQMALVLAGLVGGLGLARGWQAKAASPSPMQLGVIAILFTLVKLPAPFYVSWLRVLVPAVANGVLWQVGILYFQWRNEQSRLANRRRR